MTLLRNPTRVSAAADKPASYGNQTISSTRPSCWIQISTVDVINIAADHQMFVTLTGELSWQRLRRSAVDFYSKKKQELSWRKDTVRLQCAVPTSEKFTVQLCALYSRHDVIRLLWPRSWQCAPSALSVNVKKFKKAGANGGSNYGNQTISSTRPSCCIQIWTVMRSTLRPTIRCLLYWTGN